MAWVSPRVYAILSKSEEGKDIIEQLPDMTQDECQEELDRFFGKGGKGYKSNAEYSQAKFDDEAEEERYKSIGDEEVDDDNDLEDVQLPTEEEKAKWKEEDEEYGRQMKEKYGELPDGWENMSEEQIAKKVAGKKVEIPEDEEAEYERNKKQFKDFIVNHENYKPMVSAIKTQQGLMDKLNKQGFLNSADNKKWYDTTKKIADLTHKIEKDYEGKIGMNHFMSASAIAEYELMKGK